MRHRCLACQSSFAADSRDAREHDGLCPSCFDLRQILAFATWDVDAKVEGNVEKLTKEKILETIVIICKTRLAPVLG